jgi:BirA family biotin operon repressor/biotin-[acetyl-CoA-carboxylase] ligase
MVNASGPREEWHLQTTWLGQRVLVFDQVGSTNTMAAALAGDPVNAGIVILADEQLAGRGTHGRTWQCPAGAGVLMSALVIPPPELRRPALLTAWAAVSVCETIERYTGLQARIKWPNDVLIDGRKVCGILIEQGRATVVGIGLNVHQSASSFAEAHLADAGSLALFTGRQWDRSQIARGLIEQLDQEYGRLYGGDLDGLEARWKARTGLIGQDVMVESLGQMHQGRLCDLRWEGVGLELPEGKLLQFRPELVTYLRPVGPHEPPPSPANT